MSFEMEHTVQFLYMSDIETRRSRRTRAKRVSPQLAGMIKTTVMQIYNVPPDQMLSPSRGAAQVALARQVAMYLTHVIGRIDYAEVGRCFGRDRTTVQHACAVVEDRRDDPQFDRTVHLLEGIVETLGGFSGNYPARLVYCGAERL
jgi:chromosomal replication initiation ATPase DnaA